jgi:hypothetical protein
MNVVGNLAPIVGLGLMTLIAFISVRRAHSKVPAAPAAQVEPLRNSI